MVRRPALAAARAVLLALPAAALGQGVSAPHRATAILHSVLVAPALIDYEGTKIISTRRGDRVETVTVLEAHKRPNQTRLEFLSPDSLVGRLVVDNGVEAWHYEPSLHTAFQGPTLTRPGRAADQLRGLLAAYGVALMGTEEVIGRPAGGGGGGRRRPHPPPFFPPVPLQPDPAGAALPLPGARRCAHLLPVCLGRGGGDSGAGAASGGVPRAPPRR